MVRGSMSEFRRVPAIVLAITVSQATQRIAQRVRAGRFPVRLLTP